MTEQWLEAAPEDSLGEGILRPVFPGGLPVLLVRRGPEIFAIENRCAHMGCPLAAGKLEGHILECPCHDWRFDIRDGSFLAAPELALKTYKTELRNGSIFVRIL